MVKHSNFRTIYDAKRVNVSKEYNDVGKTPEGELVCPFDNTVMWVVMPQGGLAPFLIWQCQKCKYVRGQPL